MPTATQAVKGSKRTFVQMLPQHGSEVMGGKAIHLVIPVKDADGSWTTRDIDVSKAALAIVDKGMNSAYTTEKIWKAGAVTLVREFFNGYEPKKTLTGAAIVEKLVGMKDSMQAFFGTLVVRHPMYNEDVSRIRAEMASGKTQEKDGKASIESYMRTIRATANNQRNKVLDYFAQEFASDTAKDDNTRNTITAHEILDAARKDWQKRIDGQRGKFADVGERTYLQAGVDAVTLVIAQHRANNKAAAPTSLKDLPQLNKPVGRKAKQASKKPSQATRLLKGEVPTLETVDGDE